MREGGPATHGTGRPGLSAVSDRGVTLRAVLLALILIPVDNYWITTIEVRWYSLDGTCLPLFITPIFILFLLALGNMAVRRASPGLALRRGELLTVYMMVVMGATLASHDLLQNLFGAIGYPHHAAADYRSVFSRYLPEHLLVSDRHALEGFYQGGADPWVWRNLQFWLGPLAWWGGLMMVLISMMMCLNVIIRKQWTEHEKLSFPLIQLPVAMSSSEPGKFFGSGVMWCGFAVAFLIGLINGLHVLYPSTPYIEGIKHYNVGQFITASPWNAVARGGNGFHITMYPFTIGLTYFMPLDLSFSCWFFYLVRKLVQVFGAAMGWDAGANKAFPYYESQAAGAWLALGSVIIIGSRAYLKGVWKQAFRPGGTAEEIAESSLYRKSFYGLALGAVALLGFTHWMGMSAWVAIAFFTIYFILAIAMTRVRAELGTPHEIFFVNPQQIMVSVLGYNLIGPANLTLIWTMYWFNRSYRSHPMPNQLESFKMAEGTAIRLKPMISVLMLAAFVGIVSTYYLNLNLCYRDGAEAKCLGFKWWAGAESFDHARDNLINKPGPEAVNIAYMVVGAAIVLGLSSMRGAFVGWPFHPAGYALAVSYAMDHFWFAILVSWFVKLMIVRYGGMRLYNRLVPFFLGLVLGDFCVGSMWAIVGPIIGAQTYRVYI